MQETAEKSTEKNTPPGPTHEATMAQLRAAMERLGDLPIFSTTMNRVRKVSGDPASNAMEVAQAVMNDAHMSTKLLRLANSAYYNRGAGSVTAISRAVVLLGFETVNTLTLTLKLIETFQNQHPAIDMNRLLVRAFIAANFVRQVGFKAGVRDVEQAYVCALLYNLGEAAVAYCLPEAYLSIQALQTRDGLSPCQAAKQVLGTGFDAISQDIAAGWEFPATVVDSMGGVPPKVKGVLRSAAGLQHALACCANQAVSGLYAATGSSDNGSSIQELLETMATATGLTRDTIATALEDSFEMACNLSGEYGLNPRSLTPALHDGQDPAVARWARRLAFFVHARAPAAAPSTPSFQDTATPAGPGGDASLQLRYMQDITRLITSEARLNAVFVKVMEAMRDGAGCDRVVLCLVSPDRSRYAARLAVGEGTEPLKAALSRPINGHSDLFSQVLIKGGEYLFDPQRDGGWRQLLPPEFATLAPGQGFVLAALHFDKKPVGFFYADCDDRARAVSPEIYAAALQFVEQARLALRVCH
ncbi:MAG TPA: HDOD domain-containing protein [Gammaproteobacteria bacterium]|nr:HDOD domain-containing protein [Gammaproteobacteria bacterium]